MQLIVLEGPDGSGKTTTIEEFLKQRPDIEKKSILTHWTKPNPQLGQTAFEYWTELIAKAYQTVTAQEPDIEYWIWDRSFIGNYIYGNYKKDQIALDFTDLVRLMTRMDRLFTKASWHLFRPSKKDLKVRLAAKHETYITYKEAFELGKTYQDLFAHFILCKQQGQYPNQKFYNMPFKMTVDEAINLINKHIQ